MTTPEVGAHFAEQIQPGLARAYREQETSYIQKLVAWVGVFLLLACVLGLLLLRWS